MTKSYPEIAGEVVSGAARLREALPDAMAGAGALGKAAYKDGALSGKMKELVALAIGVASRCEGCVAWHAKMVAMKGATREEVAEMLAVTIQMGGGPSQIYAGEALAAYDAFVAERAARG
ncbi:MAG: carboxymuconolactone decarboxylase family protein [Hyphomicrobiaceae bacterium]